MNTNENYNDKIKNVFANQMQNTNQDFYSSNTNHMSNANGNKKNLKKMLFVIIAIIVIVIIGFLIYKKFFNKLNNDFAVNNSTAFFLKNNNDKYALFNEDGKKLTEFIFDSVSSIVNGTAKVTKDGQVGIISANGKMTVDFGKYTYISFVGGLYKAHGEDYHDVLINGYGNQINDLENASVSTFLGVDTYLILEDENDYSLLDYNGSKIISFPIVDGANDPITNSIDGYASVFYNNQNYILDVGKRTEIMSFNSDKPYCVNRVEEDGKLVILNSCGSRFNNQNKTYYKAIADGKLIDFDGECDGISFYSGSLICIQNNQNYILDSNYKKGLQISNLAYLDNRTYAKNKNGSFEGVDFYNNGNVIKNVSCRKLKGTGFMSNGLFILGTYYSTTCNTTSGTYEFYKSNGEKAFDRSFASAEKADNNGLAIVSEDKVNYYLIDFNGKQIGKEYDGISFTNGYYVVTKNGKKGLIDKDGNEIISCKYSNINITLKKDKLYALLKSLEQNVVYDLEEHKEILSSESPISLHNNYISTTKDGKTQYYSYVTGEMFYEA